LPKLGFYTYKNLHIAAEEAGRGIKLTPWLMARDARWGRVWKELAKIRTSVKLPPQGFQEMICQTTILSNILLVMVLANQEEIIIPCKRKHVAKIPFLQAAVDAGVFVLMNSFNELNGIPATGNAFTEGYFKERVEF
jgi:beta-glucosidase